MKKVELIIEIDDKGKITVTPKGTKGKECLDLMSFLDKLDDFTIIETVVNEDMGRNSKITLNTTIKENIKE